MPNSGFSGSRAPKGAKSSNFKPREDGRGGRAPHRADRPTGDRPAGERGAKRPFFERAAERPARDDRRDGGSRDGRPARDGGRDERAPRARWGSDERAARDARPARDDRGASRTDRPQRDGRRDWAPREDRDRSRPTEGRREWAPREDRAPRGDRFDRPARDDRSGSDRPQRDGRRDWSPREKPARYRDDRPARDDRAPRRDFDDSRRPDRTDRVERDRSRDRSFEDRRATTPNKKAFFEDVKLERLASAESVEIAENFEGMGLNERLVSALSGMGAEKPFPIQAATIPAAITGRDVLGRGKTGSGKTIAFTVPMITKLVAAGSVPRQAHKPRALVLAPTRELADQIDRTVSQLARSVGFYTTCIYGGVPQRKQEIAMQRGVDIVVATPGRLEDLMAQRVIDLSLVETLVVDEADHMCDLGFIEGVRRIMRAAGESQKLLFSATLDREVDALVKEFLPEPFVYEVPNEEQDTSNITHRVLVVDQEDRSQVLLRLVQGEGKSLIFTRTKMTAERLSESLTAAGVPAARLHGDLNQNQRNRNLERFTRGDVRVLVATDVAARGIHVDNIGLVIQLDPPEEYKTYLHRSGRTGRAHHEGTVITLIPRTRRRRMEDLLKRAERDGIFTDVRPTNPLLEELAGPIAPPPVADSLDFGDSRGGGRGGDRRGSGDRSGNARGDRGGYRGGNSGGDRRGGGNRKFGGESRGGDRPARARRFD